VARVKCHSSAKTTNEHPSLPSMDKLFQPDAGWDDQPIATGRIFFVISLVPFQQYRWLRPRSLHLAGCPNLRGHPWFRGRMPSCCQDEIVSSF